MRRTKPGRKIAGLCTLALAAALLAACEEEGAAEKAGKDIDKATKQAGESLKKAGEKAKEALK